MNACNEELAARKQLERVFNQRYQASLSDWPSFAECFELRKLAEDEHWIRAGDITKQMCFIVSGLLRIYYIDQNGNEVNQHFYQAEEVLAPISVMVSNEPCQYYVQALEGSVVLLANSDALFKLGSHNIEWLRLENNIMKTVFLKTAKREAKLLLGNAEQRYKWFLKEYPELAVRLPQYHIASFLGITPVSLSRLRKKISS
ncbi:MAG: Crp/Fnr family transcriptional regulator [Bermanella sp.]